MMKNLFKNTAILAFSAVLASCASATAPGMQVEVKNNTNADRDFESIEVLWSDITSKLENVTPDNVIILDGKKQIPSQVLFVCGDSLNPSHLLFQASVPSNKSNTYTISVGEKEDYPQQAFSRHITERMDDYAWENNIIAQRVYGKSLEVELCTPGVDVWVKRVPKLVLDEWYKRDNYHLDNGEGMDCYKVGPTLGAGGAAPLVNDSIVLSKNWTKYERVSNGPIRTEFTLRYEPFMVDGKKVTMSKTFILDANKRFTKVIDLYGGDFTTFDVGIGFVVHTPEAPSFDKNDILAIYEPASDDKPKTGGEIGVGVIVPCTSEANTVEIQGHDLKKILVAKNKPNEYYLGSAWSKGGMETAEEWFEYCEKTSEEIKNPLEVVVK